MVRIALVPSDTAGELADGVRVRRGGKLLAIDRMALNSPPFAEGLYHLAPRVRFQNAVEQRYLEVAICLVGLLTGAQYEYHHHLELWRNAGATDAKIEGLSIIAAGGSSTSFDLVEEAVIALALEMTRQVEVSESTVAKVREHFDERQFLDLVAIIAFYNMIARLLVAMDIQVEDDEHP